MAPRVPYREAIELEPQALRSALATTNAGLDAADLTSLRSGTIGLIGIGASLYAALSGASQLRAQGRRAIALAGGELYDPAVDAADAYIAVSASGRSIEPAKATSLRSRAVTFGIAQSADTPMQASVGQMIGTGSGVDSGPNTTSYLGSLLALALIAERVGTPSGFDWSQIGDLLEQTRKSTADAVARASTLLAGKRSIDCVGANVAYGTAGYTALLLREAVRVPAQNWDTLNFLHGPMEPNDSGTGVIVFGDGREVQLAQDLAGFGIATVLVTTHDVADSDNLVVVRVPATPNGLATAILSALPAQLIIADLAESAGLPVCVFRYRQTDTKLPEQA